MSPAKTYSHDRLMRFIQSKVNMMEAQQRVIEHVKSKGELDPSTDIIVVNQIANYNYTFDLCRELGIEMPHVLGVTPR